LTGQKLMDKDDQASRKRKKKKLQNQLEKWHVIKGPRLPKSNNSETENRKCFKIDRELPLLMLNVVYKFYSNRSKQTWSYRTNRKCW